jgi:hypothetical protein
MLMVRHHVLPQTWGRLRRPVKVIHRFNPSGHIDHPQPTSVQEEQKLRDKAPTRVSRSRNQKNQVRAETVVEKRSAGNTPRKNGRAPEGSLVNTTEYRCVPL